MTQLPTRVDFAPAAVELLQKLYRIHGFDFMFHQSGGCCDGSSPMLFQAGEYRVSGNDVMMQEVAVEGLPNPIKFYMSLEQFELWRHTHLTIDAVPGRGAGFSLEAPEGVRFLTRSRMFTDEEALLMQHEPVELGTGELVTL